MELESLEFSQFENLLRQRIPFRLFVQGVELTKRLGPMEKIALRNCLVEILESEPKSLLKAILNALAEAKADLQSPILVCTADEKKSAWLQAEISKQKFLNVFYLRDSAS